MDAPVSAALLGAVVDGLTGPTSTLLPPRVRSGDRVGLRILAALHRLILDGDADLPREPGPAQRSAVADALRQHPEVLAHYLARVPQTNEIGRGRQLRRALAEIPGPVRLFELGASAGLNLHPEQWTDAHDAARLPEIVERGGCDLDPLDPRDPDDVALLRSYVWIDNPRRREALDRALAWAADMPAAVVRRSAADYAASLTLQPGTDTVIWHSALLMYLDGDERRRLAEAIEALGARATAKARLWHISWEWRSADDADHALRMRSWGAAEGGSERVLAAGSTHGVSRESREPA